MPPKRQRELSTSCQVLPAPPPTHREPGRLSSSYASIRQIDWLVMSFRAARSYARGADRHRHVTSQDSTLQIFFYVKSTKFGCRYIT